MQTITKDKQIENLLVAQAIFQDIPARCVDVGMYANLKLKNIGQGRSDPHTCGAVGCFGGWIAIHPHFQKQGVFPDTDGVPCHEDYNVYTLSEHLFGHESMFSGHKWATNNWASNRSEVLARIEHQLERLTQD